MPTKRLPTSVQVDGLYRQRTSCLHIGNPYGRDILSLSEDTNNGSKRDCHGDFEGFYSMICNCEEDDDSHVDHGTCDSNNDRGNELTEALRLEMVLMMNGGERGEGGEGLKEMNKTKYRPTHVVCGEVCMVLRTRAFYIAQSIDGSETVLLDSPPPHPFNATMSLVRRVVAREIAFAPSPRDRPSSFCGGIRDSYVHFDIPELDIRPCSPEEAAKIKKRSEKAKERSRRGSSPTSTLSSLGWRDLGSRGRSRSRSHSFGSGDGSRESRGSSHSMSPLASEHKLERPFQVVRPIDDDAFRLARAVLRHRLRELQAEIVAAKEKAKGERPIPPADLTATRLALRYAFQCQRRRWEIADLWPINREGKDAPNEYAEEPPVQSEYCFPKSARGFTRNVWDSFVGTIVEEKQRQCSTFPRKDSDEDDLGHNGLGIFRTLAREKSSPPKDKGVRSVGPLPVICARNRVAPVKKKASKALSLPLYDHGHGGSGVGADTVDRYWSEQFLTDEGSLLRDWKEWEQVKRFYCHSGQGPVAFPLFAQEIGLLL